MKTQDTLTAVYTRACISAVTQSFSPFMRPDHESGKLPYVGVVRNRDTSTVYMTAPFSLRHHIVPTSSYPSVRTRLYCPVWEESTHKRLFGLVLAHMRGHITCTVVRCALYTDIKLDTTARYTTFETGKMILEQERKQALHPSISSKKNTAFYMGYRHCL